MTDLKRGDYEGARSIKNNPAGELYNEAAREVSQKPLTAQRSPVNGKASITLNSHDHCLSVTIQNLYWKLCQIQQSDCNFPRLM